jgi:3-hydroxyacyl-CoA dehydrogenase
VVGLDTMAHVVKTMHDTLPDDPWHDVLRDAAGGWPRWSRRARSAQKTKAGFYRKVGKDIQVLDPAKRDYATATGAIAPEVAES